jgi:hypothetical protein
MDTAVKPQGCTNIKLRQLMRRVAQHYDAEVGKTGLKGTQYSLLSYVVKLTRNLRPLIDAGWLVQEPGVDGRSRLVSVTDAGREKRQEAQRRWRVAQEGINETLGARRVVELHTLIDHCLELLSPLPEEETDE